MRAFNPSRHPGLVPGSNRPQRNPAIAARWMPGQARHDEEGLE